MYLCFYAKVEFIIRLHKKNGISINTFYLK
jgi:hypothetical protein